MIFIEKSKYKKLSGIYKITQISSGKVYIGQTKMYFIKRYWNHVWKLKNNLHDNIYLQNSWNKYGENDFKFEALHITSREDDMNKLEIMYIAEYKSSGIAFNLTMGGEGKKGIPTSERTKSLIGEKIENTI